MTDVAGRHFSKDLISILFLLVLSGTYCFFATDLTSPPFEDAAILMRYSRHLADGQGIVWNIGEKPLDGATDFLFMAAVAGCVKLGFSLEMSVRLLGFLAHGLTVALLYIFIRILYSSGPVLAFVSAAFLIAGPGPDYIAAYFGTPVFALFALIAWFLLCRIAQQPKSRVVCLLFAGVALIMGLIRPEGVLLACFMAAALVYKTGLKHSRRALLCFALVFCTLGAAYFFWRWSYFGHPLPNPFYKKGGGALHFDSLAISVAGGMALVFPFWLAFILAFRNRETAKAALFAAIPVFGFLCLWVLMSNEMNYHLRFQYCVVPIMLLSWPSFIAQSDRLTGRRYMKTLAIREKTVFVAALLFLLAGIVITQVVINRTVLRCLYTDGRYDMAKMLSIYKSKGYTIATSEAGILPLYSGWKSLDTWGLNDAWISRHGVITCGYLDAFKPEVIAFHSDDSPIARGERKASEEKFNAMVDTLKRYARQHNYVCAASFGDSPYETHYYYVKADSGFADSKGLVENIRKIRYRWYVTG
jgi:hypothetical protein